MALRNSCSVPLLVANVARCSHIPPLLRHIPRRPFATSKPADDAAASRHTHPPPAPVIGVSDAAATAEGAWLTDPFLTPQVITQRMYQDLITGAAKAHLPEAAPLHFPDGYFQALNAFSAQFGLSFRTNELLLRAMTHKSYAMNWLNPRAAKKVGWWRSPEAVATVGRYEQVVHIVSNSTLAALGLSLLYFLAQSYLFQKYPTASAQHLFKEGRALCAAPLVASLGSAHFLLATNKLVLADLRGTTGRFICVHAR